MQIDLLPAEVWEAINEKVKAEIQAQENQRVCVYKGLAHGVFEICANASHFFTHKRAMGVVRGTTPVVPHLLPGFYRDGYQVQTTSVLPLDQQKAWVDGLKKDTNFAIYSSDHPFTGEIYPWKSMDQVLNDRKIFSIRISHSDWLRSFSENISKVNPYSIHIFSCGPDAAIAICGEKVKSAPILAAHFQWDENKVLESLRATRKDFLEDQKRVLELAGHFPHHRMKDWQILDLSENRLFDRALLYSREHHGEAVAERLAELYGLDKGEIGKRRFETANLGRWNAIYNFFDWWEGRPDLDVIRGLIVVDAHVLEKPTEFIENLRLAGLTVGL